MKRLWVAFSAYAVFAVLAAVTIEDRKFKLATLAILAMFAVRTLIWHRKTERERGEHRENRPGDR